MREDKSRAPLIIHISKHDRKPVDLSGGEVLCERRDRSQALYETLDPTLDSSKGNFDLPREF